jgi:hypothetical protein
MFLDQALEASDDGPLVDEVVRAALQAAAR